MSRKYILFFALLLVGLFSNFNIPKKVVDKVMMVTVAGYDYVDENIIQGTVIVPDYTANGSVIDLLYTDTASMIYENREKLNAQASENLVNGKLEVALYNKELARNGLLKYLDFLQRDPGIGAKLYLGVVDGSSYELMDQSNSIKGTGVFLSDMIESNTKHGNIPTTNLKMFSYAVYSKLSDPYLPELGIHNGVPSLTGIALFKRDKYVDTIPIGEGVVFRILLENVEEGKFHFEMDEYKMVVENLHSSRKIRVKKQNGRPEVTFEVSFRGAVVEFTGTGKLSNKVTSIQKDINKNFNKRAEKLIKQLQELNVDPLGIKERIRSNGMDYNTKELDKMYPELTIKTDIHAKIKGYGTQR